MAEARTERSVESSPDSSPESSRESNPGSVRTAGRRDDEGGSPGGDLTDVLMTSTRLITAVSVSSLVAVSAAMTVAQFRVLVILSESAPLNLTAVADRLGVDASTASRLCERLVRSGHVDRQQGPHDRRHVSLALTRSGRRVLTTVLDRRRELLAAAVRDLSGDERDRLHEALTAFNRAAAPVLEPPTGAPQRQSWLP